MFESLFGAEMPLAVRFLLLRLEAIPPENFRLAAQLGLSSAQLFRLVEWPQISRSLLSIAGLIFLLARGVLRVVDSVLERVERGEFNLAGVDPRSDLQADLPKR